MKLKVVIEEKALLLGQLLDGLCLWSPWPKQRTAFNKDSKNSKTLSVDHRLSLSGENSRQFITEKLEMVSNGGSALDRKQLVASALAKHFALDLVSFFSFNSAI